MNAYTISFITLYIKELKRFTKIPGQTILAPAATTLLFMIIFSTAIGKSRSEYILTDFKLFLFPGLIMMTIIQNAFMNNSSSLLMSKVQGNIVDLLMPPISNFQIMAPKKLLINSIILILFMLEMMLALLSMFWAEGCKR